MVETGPTTPLRNLENETERICDAKETELEVKPEVKEEVEIIKENFSPKVQSTTPRIENKNVKIKKVKVKRGRGEKRKLPDKTEPARRIKRKRKDEKLGESDLFGKEKTPFREKKDVEVIFLGASPSVPQPDILLKKDDIVVTENDSDVENREGRVKEKCRQRSSRKRNAIANSCKETLEILVRLGSDILDSMDRSLKILNSHNLLSNKYVSMTTLMDLVSLALGTSKGTDNEKDLNLSKIVLKCTEELCTTPKPSKAKKNILAAPVSPKDKSIVEEDVLILTAAPSDEVEEKPTASEDAEEKMEECQLEVVELQDRSQEPAVEKSGKNFCITNYFKKLKKTVDERDKNERFSCFTAKTDMFLAPKLGGELTGERRQKFEEEFSSQTCSANYLAEHAGSDVNKCNKKVLGSDKSSTFSRDNVEMPEEKPSQDLDGQARDVNASSKEEALGVAESGLVHRKRITLIRVDPPKIEPTLAVTRAKAKLLQFHTNRRPPYWGTWRRRSETVGPRRPFEKDKMLNYEFDSDDEWESEEEPGESLHGSDDEKEPEEDYEVDNDFFVPHGYLSDDENPENEKDLSPKTKLNLLEEQFTSEQKQKTRKMTPFVFGSFWAFKGLASEESLYQDLQLERLQYFPWITTPIQIEEEEKKNEGSSDQEPTSQVKKSRQKIFPEEEIPNLIKMIHGSPQNSDLLAKKFLLYWEAEKVQDGKRPGLTKICVLKKIKELAAWQPSQEKGKMCWHVPKETRKEFGAEVEPGTPPKKPRKCFIWKFVKKADKGGGLGSSSSPSEPEVVVLES